MLSLKADYAICEKICVPAEGKAELTLSGKPGAQDDKLRKSEVLVPKPAALGGDGALGDPRQRGATARASSSMSRRPMARRSNCSPKARRRIGRCPSRHPSRARQPASSVLPSSSTGFRPIRRPDGATLTLTAVAGEQAIEVPYRLD